MYGTQRERSDSWLQWEAIIVEVSLKWRCNKNTPVRFDLHHTSHLEKYFVN